MTRALLLVPCAACLIEPGAPACRPAGALPNASTSDLDTDPWLSEDRLELVFVSMYHQSTFDLFRTTRASPDAPFDAPAQIVELATSGFDSGPFIEDDGRTIWFASGPDDNHQKIFTATRTDRSQPFGAVTEVTALGAGGHPSFTSDLLTIYIERLDGMNFNLYTATRSSTSTLDFSTPTRLEELVSNYSLGNPSITGDGSLLYYDTYAVNGVTPRIVHSHRGADGRFEPFQIPIEIDTASVNFTNAARVLRDGKTVVYSARTATKDQDIYTYCE